MRCRPGEPIEARRPGNDGGWRLSWSSPSRWPSRADHGDFGLTWDEPAYRTASSCPRSGGNSSRGPGPGPSPQPARPRDAPLLLAVRPVRDQLPSSPGRPVEPGGPRGLRLVDEGHPRAADGLGDRVRPDDRDRVRVPGPPVRDGGRPGDGRLAPAHAAALRPGPPDRHRHPGPLALGGHRPGLLEGLYEPNEAGAGGCWSGCCWAWRSSRRWPRSASWCRSCSGWWPATYPVFTRPGAGPTGSTAWSRRD